MNEQGLKALENLGAELGAAKAEVERLRGLLRELRDITSEYAWDADLEARVDAALPQQSEPTDTFTAVDMATAAAQGFRDGQAAVEQAAAQDEQQPAFLLEIGSDGEYAVLVRDKSWLRAMRNKREHQEHKLYAAPIVQTVPQPEQSGLVEAASGALAAIQDALEDAYHNAYPECCGQAYLECCGSPLQAWSEADQKTMERFAPHEKALRAALSAQGAGDADS